MSDYKTNQLQANKHVRGDRFPIYRWTPRGWLFVGWSTMPLQDGDIYRTLEVQDLQILERTGGLVAPNKKEDTI